MHDHDDMLDRTAAVDRVLALREAFLPTRDTERVALADVGGRVLAESVVADVDAPAHSHATMDGFAFDARESYPFELREGEVFPEGDPGDLEPGQAARIATGAPVPRGATAVIKREDATVANGELRAGPDVSPGTYVYERGSNFRAGDELFAVGDRLGPKDAILLGDLGRDDVEVYERLSVGVLATGTEIHEGVSRDLDSAMLQGLVDAWGHEATFEGSAPDEYDRVESLVTETAERHDVVVTTGGTSVGHKDHVVRALSELGEVLFHRVRLRPGKPIAVARLADHDAVAFAIPGKPVGAHTVATLVARPFFTGDVSLPTVAATLARDVGLGPSGFEYAVPVTLARNAETGTPEAMPLGHADSPLSVYADTFDPSVLSSSTRATRADGVVVTTEPLAAGDSVRVVPYPVLE
ncbi:molybdopterin molybdotransferase [Halogranum amylolyticum]|uniref:Molybdopterin molybdotransferase n=1 Tax=Halogranum amylolyticum TaxID=660520 RepID=A0A1H8WEI9_9EURY|nr:molybdopterin molybdotransferase MoeA [Halogranum amylolyticum]SEP26082.1 molybdopterin molybdotransferase [Halogranum amylolyticum]